jgi:hypothetical protein
LSLSEGFLISLESIQSLISLHRNDLSRSIVSLNYWATSGGVGASGKSISGQKELLRVSDELPEADCQKLEKAIFNSAIPKMSLDELSTDVCRSERMPEPRKRVRQSFRSEDVVH